jgi:hypothetical protein
MEIVTGLLRDLVKEDFHVGSVVVGVGIASAAAGCGGVVEGSAVTRRETRLSFARRWEQARNAGSL